MATLNTQLDQLESAQLVRRAPDEDLSYLFRHALTQEVTYDTLLLRRRHEVHRLVAEAYEKINADNLDQFAALLAQHYSAAGDDEKIVEYAIRAGDHAGRLGGEPEAGAHYALALVALSRLPDTDENRRLHIDTLIKQTSVSFASASPEHHLNNLHEAESLVENLIRTDATSSADRLRLARVQTWIARMHFIRQDRVAALKDFRNLLLVAQDLGDEELAAFSSTMMARIWVWEGEFGRALPLLQQGLPWLERRQNWTEWILTCSQIGIACAAQGDYQAGVESAERALKRANELQHLNGRAIAYESLALTHLMGGAIQAMLEASRASVQIGIQSGSMIPVFNGWVTQAWAESRLGDHQAAQESMAQAEAIARQSGGHLFFDDWLAAVQVEMALNVRQIEETIRRAEEAISYIRSAHGKFAEAVVQRAWGEALSALNSPRWEEAEAHYSSSLELFNSGEAVLEVARTHVAWGQLLQACGNANQALEHFQKAAAQFESSGLIGELERTKLIIDSISL